METAAMKEVFTHSSLETGGTDIMQGHMGKHQDWSEGRGNEGELQEKRTYMETLWFLWEGMLEAQQADLVLASLSNFDGL